MPTVHRKRFFDRLFYFETDVEFTDAIVNSFKEIVKDNPGQTIAEACGVSSRTHPILSKRSNTRMSREVVANHLRFSICSSFIKDLHEEFSLYLQAILSSAALKGINPKRFVGEHQMDIKASEILALSDWDTVVKFIADNVFRSLKSERSTLKLMAKFDGKLGLELSGDVVKQALPYLELRHILVHSDGKIDTNYRKAFPQVRIRLGKDNKVRIDVTTVRKAKSAVGNLVNEIDSRMIQRDLVADHDILTPPRVERVSAEEAAISAIFRSD